MLHERRLYLAARDHLEQADAVLAAAGEEMLQLRGMIRCIACILEERASLESPEKETVVAFPVPRQRDGRLEY